MFLEGVVTEAPHEYLDYVLCREMGWSYHDLVTTPRSFVESMLLIQGIVKKREHRQRNRSS